MDVAQPKLWEEPKSDIPTVRELDAWLEGLKEGYATTEMLPRFVAGYKQLSERVQKLELYLQDECCVCDGGQCKTCQLLEL